MKIRSKIPLKLFTAIVLFTASVAYVWLGFASKVNADQNRCCLKCFETYQGMVARCSSKYPDPGRENMDCQREAQRRYDECKQVSCHGDCS